MTTVLQYVVIAAVVGLALFGIAVLLFGRGEQMAALPARTSPAQLPADSITGEDVRKVRFALALRGYRMSDVDWALERIADELDRARARLVELEGTTAASQEPDDRSAGTAPEIDDDEGQGGTEVAEREAHAAVGAERESESPAAAARVGSGPGPPPERREEHR